MEAYTDFADLYDEFMVETPYDEWLATIKRILSENGINDGLICELGSGTGEMTRRLRDEGYDMIGVDSSISMLNVAKNKEGDRGDILYLCQDMREFELYGTVRAIVSVCDCVNYILEPEEMLQVFKLCNNYLDPKGLLIFDFNTDVKYAEIDDATIAENKESASFIWDNYYDFDSKINQYDITFFTREESGLFRRFTETHVQRGYTLSEMKELILRAGMEFVDAFDADEGKKADENSGRILIVAKESGK